MFLYLHLKMFNLIKDKEELILFSAIINHLLNSYFMIEKKKIKVI